MSNTKSLRVSATNGNEEIVKENYKIIRELANRAAEKFKIKIDDVINFMTATTNLKTNEIKGLKAGSFNNYCRNGKVSEYTCDKLNSFFENEIPFSVLTGQERLTLENAVIIFAVLMDKLNNSDIVKIRMGKTDNNTTVYYKKKDFIEILIQDLKNGNIGYSEDKYVDASNFEELSIEIESLVKENNEFEEYNDLFIRIGLDPLIHENEKFVSNISIETLWKFDLDSLKNCHESYKKVTEILESIVKLKEIKKETEN